MVISCCLWDCYWLVWRGTVFDIGASSFFNAIPEECRAEYDRWTSSFGGGGNGNKYRRTRADGCGWVVCSAGANLRLPFLNWFPWARTRSGISSAGNRCRTHYAVGMLNTQSNYTRALKVNWLLIGVMARVCSDLPKQMAARRTRASTGRGRYFLVALRIIAPKKILAMERYCPERSESETGRGWDAFYPVCMAEDRLLVTFSPHMNTTLNTHWTDYPWYVSSTVRSLYVTEGTEVYAKGPRGGWSTVVAPCRIISWCVRLSLGTGGAVAPSGCARASRTADPLIPLWSQQSLLIPEISQRTFAIQLVHFAWITHAPPPRGGEGRCHCLLALAPESSVNEHRRAMPQTPDGNHVITFPALISPAAVIIFPSHKSCPDELQDRVC